MPDSSVRDSRLLAYEALKRAGKTAFKPISSAKWVDIKRSWTGKLHVQIMHEDLKGVSPAMLFWWFRHLGCTTTWNGVDFSGPEVRYYHLWHHRDHVAVTPVTGSTTGFAVGAKTRIDEQFNDYKDIIQIEATTLRFTENEHTFIVKKFGMKVCELVHLYNKTEDGSSFYCETIVGLDIPIFGWFVNWVIVPFIYSRQTAENWIRHNVEEVGRSEDVIPPLYKEHCRD